MNTAKIPRIPSPVHTWCWRCNKPVEWWTMAQDGFASIWDKGTFLPIITVGCHGDQASLGCHPAPEVRAEFQDMWERCRAGTARIEFNPDRPAPNLLLVSWHTPIPDEHFEP